ncbi:hypothetical protein SAMN05446935_5332 [Burkholderia sp. YR290]|nr:hypothetical protein SAMN05446934_4255 [Paraburkholderia hospita]SOE84876.1 hypothetical protein SAMN05446935_5332 [Burkholderia sp. YR290]
MSLPRRRTCFTHVPPFQRQLPSFLRSERPPGFPSDHFETSAGAQLG